MPTDSQPAEGLTLAGRYRLEERIASGGMAEVWSGTDLLLQRRVAVKILHAHLRQDEALVARFRREALAVARLTHPGIVGVYDSTGSENLDAMILELVPGPTLREHLDACGTLGAPEAVRIGESLTAALAVAHGAGIVHRDIKPANILLADDRVVLTDFGIAKALDEADRTSTGALLGSARYLAPEQVEAGGVDARTDLFSLGVVLYECLAGQSPWDGPNDASLALARLREPPTPPRSIEPSVPPELDELVMRCLQRDPEQRPASAVGLGKELAELRRTTTGRPSARPAPRPRRPDPDATTHLGSATAAATAAVRPPPARPPTAPPRPRPAPTEAPRHRRRWGWPVAGAVLLVVAVVVAVVLVVETDPGQDVLGRVEGALAGDEIQIESVVPFDPEGSGEPGENDHLAPQAIDGDPTTSWQTVGYYERGFGIKRGVGLVINLSGDATLRSLEVSSPTQGWAASVYVSDRTGEVLEDWGEPVAEASDIRGDATFDLGGASGDHVLLWITDLGEGPPLVRTQISDLRVLG